MLFRNEGLHIGFLQKRMLQKRVKQGTLYRGTRDPPSEKREGFDQKESLILISSSKHAFGNRPVRFLKPDRSGYGKGTKKAASE